MNKDALKEKWGIQDSDSIENDNHKENKAANQNAEVLESKYFKVASEAGYVPSIQFKCRGGKRLFLPYSSQPIIEYDPELGIEIKTLTKQVLIKGRGLVILAQWLGSQKVVWVSESTTGTDENKEDVFVESITFEDVM